MKTKINCYKCNEIITTIYFTEMINGKEVQVCLNCKKIEQETKGKLKNGRKENRR